MNIYRLVLGAYQTNTYIVIDNDCATVIDPACNAQAIESFVVQKNAKIKHILLTHAHFDHIGAVAELKRHGACVYMSALDCGIATLNDEFPEYRNTESFDVDSTVTDGDVLSLSGHEYKVIKTPGHTPDSVCYVMDDEIIFSGDTLFRLSVGRSDFAFGNALELKKSIAKLLALPHDYTVFPGHGEATVLGFEKVNNPYVK